MLGPLALSALDGLEVLNETDQDCGSIIVPCLGCLQQYVHQFQETELLRVSGASQQCHP